MVHVEPVDVPSTTSPLETATEEDVAPVVPHQKASTASPTDRKDSSMDPSHLPQLHSNTVPSIIGDTVLDTEQPEHGHAESVDLPSNAEKRTVDSRRDVEELRTEKPSISVEAYAEPGSEDEKAAPLFRHESLQAEESPLAASMDTIYEESLKSSTDQTSSSEIINTPSERDEPQDDVNLEHGSMFLSKTESDDENDELDNAPLLPHETASRNHAKRDGGAFSSHESVPKDDNGVTSDVEDEFGMAPLLPHESGFSGFARNRVVNDVLDGQQLSPRHYHPDDDDIVNGDYDDAPLLPHERSPAVASNNGSELSADDAHYMTNRRRSFEYEATNIKDFSERSSDPNFFRTRTNSSTLPHKLPPSDDEDENLHDPSLERFPTSREQILERVASIGLQLPEDETIEDSLHSPQLSVMSQACSSVDLVPVKSYISLASVPEADDIEEEDDHDVESLPSPSMFGGDRSSSDFAKDALKTPLPNDSKQFGLTTEDARESNVRTSDLSEAESVGKVDGAKDKANLLATLQEATTSPAKIFSPITPPRTPEKQHTTTDNETAAHRLDSQLRQRRDVDRDSTQTSQREPATVSRDSDDTNPKDKKLHVVKPAEQPNKPRGNALQNFLQMVYSSVGRFLTACAGNRKRAG